MSHLAPAHGVIHCRGERFRTYLTSDQIRTRVIAMGAEIGRDYLDKRPILIGALNGAFVFMADLLRAIDVDCEVDFLKLSSYGTKKMSSGEVRELKSIDADLMGRHVLVVEDIVDTGLSMQFILNRLQPLGPASIRVATCLHKPDATLVEVPLDYVGFEIPNLFVLGYGLDYGQLGRNLPDIYVLDGP
jgi:hypoxanthine phosphoribosyltransferase